MLGQFVNDEPDRMYKKLILFYFKILLWHLRHLTEQNDEKPPSEEPAFGAGFETDTSVVQNIILQRLTCFPMYTPFP
jgi:hypothetical protein